MVRKIKKCSLTCPHWKNRTSEKEEEIFNWLLKEYDCRGKELLEFEKISITLLPISITLTGTIVAVMNMTLFQSFITSVIVFLVIFYTLSIPYSRHSYRLLSKLINIETKLRDLKPHLPFFYYTSEFKPSKATILLTSKYAIYCYFAFSLIAGLLYWVSMFYYFDNEKMNETQLLFIFLITISSFLFIVSLMEQMMRKNSSIDF